MAYTLRVSDDFTVSTDTNLESHTPTIQGTGYTKISGTNSAVVEESDDTLTGPYYSGINRRCYSADWGSSYADKQRAWAIATVDPDTTARCPGVRLQTDGASSYDGYVAGASTGVNRIFVHRSDSDTLTEIINHFQTGQASSDQVGVSADGSTIELWWKGSSVASTTDATYSGGAAGVMIHKSFTSGGMDDLETYDEPAATAGPKGPLGHPFHGPFGGPV